MFPPFAGAWRVMQNRCFPRVHFSYEGHALLISATAAGALGTRASAISDRPGRSCGGQIAAAATSSPPVGKAATRPSNDAVAKFARICAGFAAAWRASSE